MTKWPWFLAKGLGCSPILTATILAELAPGSLAAYQQSCFPGTLNFRPSGKTTTLVSNSSVLLLRAVVATVMWSQAQNKLTKLGSRDVLVLGCWRPFGWCLSPVLYLVLMAVLELATLLDLMQSVGSVSLPAQRQDRVRSLGLSFFLWYNSELVLGTRSSYRAWVL